MNCEFIREQLSPYLDRELDRQDHNRVKNHLEICPDCSLYLEELRRLDGKLRFLFGTPPDPSRGFSEKLLSKARREFHLHRSSEQPDSVPTGDRFVVGVTGITFATLFLGLFLGTVMGISFLKTLPTYQTESGLEPAPSSGPVSESSLPPATVEVVSLTDAYFELDDAQSSGLEE